MNYGMRSAIESAPAPHSSLRGSRHAGLVGVFLVSLIAAACQSTTPGGQPPSAGGEVTNSRTASQARLTIAPANRSMKVDPSAGISVRVAGGTITNVTAKADGQAVAGKGGAGGT